MKTSQPILFLALALPLAVPANAGLLSETYGFGSAPLPLTPPDGTGIAVSDTREITGSAIGIITDVDVTITLSNPLAGGAFNGDFYLSLQHDSGFSVLLNRVGRRTPADPSHPTTGEMLGYADNGIGVTFDDGAANGDIHNYRLTLSGGSQSTPVDVNFVQPLTGIWAPDGRNISPLTAVATDARTAPLSVFDGMAANGTWTLQLIDFNGGGTAMLDHWELAITGTPVPEPTGAATLTAAALMTLAAWRRFRTTPRS